MRGQIGKPGAGVMPVRGHSNVQGDRTVDGSVRVQTSSTLWLKNLTSSRHAWL